MPNVKCVCIGCGRTHNVNQSDVDEKGYLIRGFLSAGCSRCAGVIRKLKSFDKWGKKHPECTEKDCGTCFVKSCQEMGLYL